MAVVEQQHLPTLTGRSILFAHRGARAHAPENTMEAFQLALRLGATGLESDVWVTSDNVAVLDHDGKVQVGRLRSRSIRDVPASKLPGHIPQLSDLLGLLQDRQDLHLSRHQRRRSIRANLSGDKRVPTRPLSAGLVMSPSTTDPRLTPNCVSRGSTCQFGQTEFNTRRRRSSLRLPSKRRNRCSQHEN